MVRTLFRLVGCFTSLAVCGIIAAAEKKPTLMILPSDHWCEMRYFMTTWNNQGTQVRTPDYLQAFQQDAELGPVVSKIGGMLTSLGYSLKDAEQELRAISIRTAEDNVTMSKTSGASLAESPLDMLKRRIKSDILIQISWQLNKEAEGRSATFTIDAFDVYTSKRIASSTGTTQPSADPLPVLLEQAVSERINEFDRQMMDWYYFQQTHGREIVLTIRCWDNWEHDLETEYDGKELLDCIQDWMRQATVRGSFHLTDGTENFAQFEVVRIKLSQDARSFANQLRKFLNAPPYEIPCKVMQRGLGEAIIVLGEK